MKKILLILFVAADLLFLNAQENIQNRRFIEITGTSETEITPDELYITITLQERNENKEKLTIEKQEAELKQNIKELGIELTNLTLSTADADFRQRRILKKDVMVTKSYILKINNAETLSKVYDRLDKMNAYDAYISRYTHSKILEYQKENRIKAVKAAKEKVDYLLAALGQQAGQPIQILESENSAQEGPNSYGKMYRNTVQHYDAVAGEEEPQISFKKIKIRSSFMVKYEILNK